VTDTKVEYNAVSNRERKKTYTQNE